MERQHIIVGNSEDYHAVAMQWALQRMGERCLLWDGLSLDAEGRLDIAFDGVDARMAMADVDCSELASVWFRRPVPFRPLSNVAERSLKFLHNELNAAHFSACTLLANAARFVVGSNGQTGSYSKAWQLKVAAELGFKIPETLISNDPARVRSFVDSRAPVLVKYFTPHFWSDDARREVSQAGPTVLRDVSRISDASIAICPAIYQRLVDKRYELRVTVIGHRLFAARIGSADDGSYLDWRDHCGHDGFVMEAAELDTQTAERIRAIMVRLDLKYGCVDLAVDQDGDTVFFEVNSGGQFLFVDDYIREFNLLGNFASMLVTGSMDYPLATNPEVSLEAFERRQPYADFANRQSFLRLSDRYITRAPRDPAAQHA